MNKGLIHQSRKIIGEQQHNDTGGQRVSKYIFSKHTPEKGVCFLNQADMQRVRVKFVGFSAI